MKNKRLEQKLLGILALQPHELERTTPWVRSFNLILWAGPIVFEVSDQQYESIVRDAHMVEECRVRKFLTWLWTSTTQKFSTE